MPNIACCIQILHILCHCTILISRIQLLHLTAFDSVSIVTEVTYCALTFCWKTFCCWKLVTWITEKQISFALFFACGHFTISKKSSKISKVNHYFCHVDNLQFSLHHAIFVCWWLTVIHPPSLRRCPCGMDAAGKRNVGEIGGNLSRYGEFEIEKHIQRLMFHMVCLSLLVKFGCTYYYYYYSNNVRGSSTKSCYMFTLTQDLFSDSNVSQTFYKNNTQPPPLSLGVGMCLTTSVGMCSKKNIPTTNVIHGDGFRQEPILLMYDDLYIWVVMVMCSLIPSRITYIAHWRVFFRILFHPLPRGHINKGWQAWSFRHCR